MHRNIIETIMGGLVLLVAITFIAFAYSSANIAPSSGYSLTARFNRIDGLTTGSDVRMAGIKVGTIVETRLDPESYQAIVRMVINDGIPVTDDSTARILNDGLLGGYFILIEPGAGEPLSDGGELSYTQDAINVVDLIAQLVFKAVDNSSGKGAAGGSTPAVAP